jgi:cyclohexanecarboxylate-CoA ligase
MAVGVWDLVERRARFTPNWLCAIDEVGRELTFGELHDRGERVAAALAELGVAPGVTVCWQLPTWIESLVLVAALARLGAVQVPLLPIYRERELRVAMTQARPLVVVTPTVWRGFDHGSLWRRLGTEVFPSHPPTIVECDQHLPECDDLGALPYLDHARGNAGADRWVFFTSGTTGSPKGARHTDDSIASGPAAFCERVGLTEMDRYPIIFPFTHIGGIGTLLAQLMTGASAVLDEQFDAERTIALLVEREITIGAGGTPLVQLYLEHQRRHPGTPLFPDLRGCLTGAAPKPASLHDDVRHEMGGRGCISVYGLTESPFLTISSLDDTDADLAGTEGRAAAGAEIRIVGADGPLNAPGDVGEIRVRGPQVCQGYLDTTLDADAFDDDGFFRTGDLGSLDERGNLTIKGRIKDVIIRRGENISALEVEHVLGAHPAVLDVAVLGLPDARTGERCCAVVVLRAGTTVTMADVRAFGEAQGLARQKLPEQLEIVDSMPRNATAKILKHELRSRLLAEVPAGAAANVTPGPDGVA